MASAGHLLVQQKAGLEGRVRLLINENLKKICKFYKCPTSGTKVILQKRCTEGERNL